MSDSVICQAPLTMGCSQASILGWVSISSSMGSSWPRFQTWVSWISCIGRRIIYHWATWETPPIFKYLLWSCCCCSVTQSCPTLCDPMDCSMPGLPVPHHLPKFAQVHVHCFSDAIQPSHPLTPSSSSALNLSQHQGLFQWVSSAHQMTKILDFKLQHQSL